LCAEQRQEKLLNRLVIAESIINRLHHEVAMLKEKDEKKKKMPVEKKPSDDDDILDGFESDDEWLNSVSNF
jgi:hypothetical protein